MLLSLHREPFNTLFRIRGIVIERIESVSTKDVTLYLNSCLYDAETFLVHGTCVAKF